MHWKSVDHVLLRSRKLCHPWQVCVCVWEGGGILIFGNLGVHFYFEKNRYSENTPSCTEIFCQGLNFFPRSRFAHELFRYERQGCVCVWVVVVVKQVATIGEKLLQIQKLRGWWKRMTDRKN
jgi:hypothetical protein